MTYNDTLPEHELLEEDPLIPEEGLPEEPDPDEFSAAGVADDDNQGGGLGGDDDLDEEEEPDYEL